MTTLFEREAPSGSRPELDCLMKTPALLLLLDRGLMDIAHE